MSLIKESFLKRSVTFDVEAEKIIFFIALLKSIYTFK